MPTSPTKHLSRRHWMWASLAALIIAGIAGAIIWHHFHPPLPIQHLSIEDADRAVIIHPGQRLRLDVDSSLWSVTARSDDGYPMPLTKVDTQTYKASRLGFASITFRAVNCPATSNSCQRQITVYILPVTDGIQGLPALPPGGLVTHR